MPHVAPSCEQVFGAQDCPSEASADDHQPAADHYLIAASLISDNKWKSFSCRTKAAGELADHTDIINGVMEGHEERAENTRNAFAAITVLYAVFMFLPTRVAKLARPAYTRAGNFREERVRLRVEAIHEQRGNPAAPVGTGRQADVVEDDQFDALTVRAVVDVGRSDMGHALQPAVDEFGHRPFVT